MRSSPSRSSWVLALVVTGCAGPKVYMVDMELEGRRVIQAAAAEPAPEARDIVRGATSLAFNPPDVCTDVKAAGAGATEVNNVMRLQCGVLMTELEAAATRAGFSVLSWQTLRAGRAMDYARENRVDILFEVNDLSFDIPVQDLYSVTNMAFSQRKEAEGSAQPLVVPDPMTTARRCQEQYWKAAQPAQTVTLDVKMVSVADGRVRWTYRDTMSDDLGQRLQVKRSWKAVPSEGANPLFAPSAVLIGAGLALVLIPMLDPPGTPQELATADTLQTIGGITIGVGAAAFIGSFFLPRQYPPADALLCQGPSIEDQVVRPAAATTAGASISFNEHQTLKGAGAEQARRRLLNAVIQKFIAAVSAMKRSPPSAQEWAPPPSPPRD